jgi:hypothetical protein
VVASRDADAGDLQLSVARGIATGDLVPPMDRLPEGLSRDEFQSGFGGISGAQTRRLFAEIDRRITGWPPLQPSP